MAEPGEARRFTCLRLDARLRPCWWHARWATEPTPSRRLAMGDMTPTRQVSEWLAALDAALQRGDADSAAALFNDDSYWRDLVSFTWNITTAEGNAKVREM